MAERKKKRSASAQLGSVQPRASYDYYTKVLYLTEYLLYSKIVDGSVYGLLIKPKIKKGV